jgi:tetratricopeptide (TPR) repeat protein
VLEETGDQWALAAYDNFVAQNFAAIGDLEAAAEAARSSVDRLRAIGEEWLILEGLTSLAILNEWRGDLDAAAATYAELITASRAAGAPNAETHSTVRLAGVRARQGDDESAARLYEQVATAAIRPVNKAWALIGRAGAARRLGERAAARKWLDEALELCEALALDLNCSAALTSLCWWCLDDGDLDTAAAFAAEACRRASAEPRSRISAAAEIAVSAVACARSGDAADVDAFTALVERRARGEYVTQLSGSVGHFFDEPDVAAFAATCRRGDQRGGSRLRAR